MQGERSMSIKIEMDQEQIRNILPHRFPFLLLDKVMIEEPPQRIRAIKQVTANEPFFVGHFPSQAIMPGVLIIEALAQITAFFFDPKYRQFYISSVKIRLLNPVLPGDTLRLEATPLKLISDAGIFDVAASVNEKLVAKGQITAKAFLEKNNNPRDNNLL
jgi:3-hydroxyacyl-[acyl-carrier-protein] dehydratase